MAQLAGRDDLGDGRIFRIGGPLRADLEHLLGALNGVEDREVLLQRLAHRLFAVDMLACVHRGDGYRSVPVVRSRNDDRVDVLVFEQLRELRVELRVLEANSCCVRRRRRPYRSQAAICSVLFSLTPG